MATLHNEEIKTMQRSNLESAPAMQMVVPRVKRQMAMLQKILRVVEINWSMQGLY